ncbi:protein qui-1 isoform X5 [Nematostella vectensis]|uniref:protein qui-1 isoform X5 n=1 Tax=Nematostella vectensis TaxID=45351 RepID=UPI00207771E2|nr:protein qui-1 isoform X5 [Nematostella vectensis]
MGTICGKHELTLTEEDGNRCDGKTRRTSFAVLSHTVSGSYITPDERSSISQGQIVLDGIPAQATRSTLHQFPELATRYKKVVCGDLGTSFAAKPKVVRIFTSSTFTDTEAERNALMLKTIPKLKLFCQEKGYEFQTFLGQKYGFRPFPPRIPGDEFLQIAAALENEHDRSLIEKWFKCDFNAVPPAYMLQPISSCLPDYLSHDRDKRSKAWEEWQLVFGRLQHVLRGAARHVLKDDEQIHKYFMSVTESEIRQGILASADPARECCWFSRNIRDLEKHVADGRAHLFIDTTREGDVDLEAQRLLGNLKKDLLHCYLPLDNVKTYDVTWSRDGISPNLNNEHRAFLPPESFVLVPKLPQKDAAEILVSYLRMEHRTLSTDQQDIVQQALQECSLPIFVRVAFDEAIRWKSYSPLDETVLQHTVRGAINSLFERVERQHGHVLVSRALGYVTAAKSGLTETELEDLLSCDDFVLDDVYQYWTPPVRRIPPLLWVRIRQDLESYLVTRGADGAQVVTWYHRQFIEAAQARYLNKKNETLQLHHNLSDYFLGRYSNGIRKPYTTPEGRETAADRLVAPQPLVFESTTGKPKYNYRKLNELPYHLVHAQELETSKDCVLCNFEFLLTSLEASSLRDVLDYFDLALTQWPEDQDITLVKETLQLSAYALTQYPAQLPSQLLGRIQKCDSRHLTTLLHQATRCSRASLVPSTCCLTSPGGPMVHALTGQTRSSTAMTASDDGSLVVSASSDNSVNLWNVATGRLVRSIEKAGENISSVLVAKDNTLIVSTCPGCVSAWRVSTGQRIFRIDTNGDCAPITTVTHGNESHLVTVVASSIRIIDLETGAIIQEFRDEKLRPEIGAHMTMGTTGSRLLYTGLRLEEDSGRLIRALDLKSGYISTVLRLDESVTSMEDLIGITADGSLLLSKSRGGNQRQRTQSAGQALTFILELWSLEKQSRMRTICNHGDRVRCFSLSSDKKNLIALCDSRFQDSTNVFRGKVKIVDLASGDSTDSYLSYPSNINFISYIDGNHFISSSNDKLLRIWDLKRNQASTENPTEVEIYEREIVSSRDDLVTFNGSGMTGILNAHTGSEIRFVNGSTPQMLIVDVARVIIADDDKMFLYDLENRAKVLDFAGATRPDNLRCFFVCKQSLLVCIAQDRKSMDVYDVVSGNKLSHLMAQSGDTEIAWFSHSSDGRYCVTAHAPESKPTLIYGYTVWNVESSALVQTLVFDMEQFIEFQDLEISHDGNYVMHIVCTANSRLYQARIYDVTSGNVLHCPETEVHVHEASFTEDAAFFLLGLMDGSLQLYDITSGLLLFSLRAHSGAIHRIFTSETVNVVMTTAGGLDSKDRSVRLWKISDQRISQLTVFTPDAKISSLVFTFGGRAVAMEITDIVTFQLVDQDTFVSCDVTHSNDAIRGSFVVDLKEL